MDHTGSKLKLVRRGSFQSNLNSHNNPETPRSQSNAGPETPRQSKRGIARGSSSKSIFSASKTDNNSRVYPDDLSRQSKARRNSFDKSEVSVATVDAGRNNNCCNMKFSDLTNDNYKDNVYNSYEATIIEDRKDNRLKHTGRSIQSIRKNPNVKTLSVAGFSKMAKSANQLRAMVKLLLIDLICIDPNVHMICIVLIAEHDN
jgi:hypothetical protein